MSTENEVYLIPISKDDLTRLHNTIRSMDDDNENGQQFSFWQTVELMEIGDEILAAAQKTGPWTPPPPDPEEAEHTDDPDVICLCPDCAPMGQPMV